MWSYFVAYSVAAWRFVTRYSVVILLVLIFLSAELHNQVADPYATDNLGGQPMARQWKVKTITDNLNYLWLALAGLLHGRYRNRVNKGAFQVMVVWCVFDTAMLFDNYKRLGYGEVYGALAIIIMCVFLGAIIIRKVRALYLRARQAFQPRSKINRMDNKQQKT